MACSPLDVYCFCYYYVIVLSHVISLYTIFHDFPIDFFQTFSSYIYPYTLQFYFLLFCFTSFKQLTLFVLFFGAFINLFFTEWKNVSAMQGNVNTVYDIHYTVR